MQDRIQYIPIARVFELAVELGVQEDHWPEFISYELSKASKEPAL
jgi:hypothetical protein